MKFSELMKNLGHTDLDFIGNYTEIQEWQDEFFYTLNLSNSEERMREVKNRVSKENPIVAGLQDNESLSEISRPLKWDVCLLTHGLINSVRDIVKDFQINNNTKSDFLDKGHLVASWFQEHICEDGKKTDPFLYKNVTSNIAYQFCDKNRGHGNKLGQLQFERAVKNEFIDKNNATIVYYEVEPIFMEDIDEIPIGTRIFAFREVDDSSQINEFVEDKKISIKLPFHVFIPNYPEKIDGNDKKIVKSFKEFYEDGNIKGIERILSESK